MIARRILALVALAIACLPSVSLAQPAWSHTFVGLPDEVVEGRLLKFRVAYSAPRETILNAQVKDLGSVVYAGDTRRVSGSGVAEFAITVPEGKLGSGLQVAIWYGLDWQNVPCPIIHSGPVTVLTPEQGRALERSEATGIAAARRLGLRDSAPVVAVLSGGWAGRDAALSASYASALKATGRRVLLLGPDDVAFRSVLDPRRVALYVVPDARTYPGAGIPALLRYLRAGGHFVAMGAPALDRLVRRSGGKWLDELQVGEMVRHTPASHSLVEIGAGGAAAWQRSANDLKSPTSLSVEPGPAPRGAALHVKISNLTGWDTELVPLAQPARPGENLVVFWARGAGPTSVISIEVREKDQSRWIAVVPLTTGWERQAVHAAAFELWDPEGKSPRRGPHAMVNLANAEAVAVGLAFTHTRVPGGKHEFWFAALGTARGPEMERYKSPVLDTISPAYKYYPVRTVRALDTTPGRALAPAVALPLPKASDILSTHPRPTGAGYDKLKRYRWVPLVQVRNSAGVGGTAATLMVHRGDAYHGGRWAAFSIAGTEWYRKPQVVGYVASLAGRMLQPAMLLEGGCEWFGCFPDESPRLGVRAVGPSGMSARLTVTEAGGKQVANRVLALRPELGEQVGETVWRPGGMKASLYRVRVSLVAGGREVDRLAHEITVRRKPARPLFMTTAGGQFSLGGKPWYPHGTNYMPSSGVAAEEGHYFEQWLSTESYDPEVIERDLGRIQGMGMNMISAFIYVENRGNRNLVDLLNRCQSHGIRVNLSLRPGTPLDFEWPGIGEIIKANRLADDPTVFAYDLAWEPCWGYRDARRRWDGEWEQWIVQRYGSIANAERDWGAPVPRENGKVVGVSDTDVTAGSRIPRVTAAYRRFQDNLLGRKHMEARRKIRTVDPHHLLSFRMSIGGDPTCGPTIMPYDFTGLARSMDFMSPEGYGRIGDKAQVRPGWFTAAYSRMVAPGRPVMWAEFGYTIWNTAAAPSPIPGQGAQDALDRRFYPPATIKFTERYYSAFYEMMQSAGFGGGVSWWYPGGFRVGENSDFGIINPDGTWRDITRIIVAGGKRLLARTGTPRIDAWIAVDRDQHPDGIFGMYTRHSADFWRLVAAGRFPGLRDAPPGVDSGSMRPVSVGNTPLSAQAPPRYLDNEFETVEVQDAAGKWVPVPYEGGKVAAGRPFVLRMVAGNNGPAAWLSVGLHSGKRTVRAMLTVGAMEYMAELPGDVASLGTSPSLQLSLPAQAAGQVGTLSMVTSDGIPFGEVRRIEFGK